MSRMIFKAALGFVGLMTLGAMSAANAAVVDAYACGSPGSNFVAVDDVTADGSDALDCFGVIPGNDTDATITFDGTVYDFLAKYNVQDGGTDLLPPEGEDIGFDYNPTDGTWTFDPDVTFSTNWLFIIKQGPCYAGWEFGAGTYSGGTYEVNWKNQSNACVSSNPTYTVSHFSFYGELGDRTEVPEPGTLALLGLGLVGLGFARRKTSG